MDSPSVVVTLLIPAQTAVIEAVVFAVKLILSKKNVRSGSANVLCVTAVILALTLSICNAVLDLNKTQKIAGSIALITQAAIVIVAQLKNVVAEEADIISTSTKKSGEDELKTLQDEEKADKISTPGENEFGDQMRRNPSQIAAEVELSPRQPHIQQGRP